MHIELTGSNPFALMTAPAQVIATMEKSDGLRKLQHKVFHPLDTRIVAHGDAELAAFDAAIERSQPGSAG